MTGIGAIRQAVGIGTLPQGELIQYWCAVAVGEELHFTRAAQRLRIDQPAVSRHIQKLEAKLGLKLFVRSGRGVELTNAGKDFLPYARKALLSASHGERLARAVTQQLEVAYSPLVDAHLIARIGCLVEDARPSAPVRFRSVVAERLNERLLEGSSQAAIGLLPVEENFAKLCILRERLFAALPATHRLAQRRAVHAAQFENDPVIWVLGSQNSIAAKHLIGLFHRAKYVPDIAREAQSVAEALGLVREGFGVAFVKSSELKLRPEGLVIRQFAEPYLAVETGLLYLREHRWEFLQEFVALVHRHLHCGENGRSE